MVPVPAPGNRCEIAEAFGSGSEAWRFVAVENRAPQAAAARKPGETWSGRMRGKTFAEAAGVLK